MAGAEYAVCVNRPAFVKANVAHNTVINLKAIVSRIEEIAKSCFSLDWINSTDTIATVMPAFLYQNLLHWKFLVLYILKEERFGRRKRKK